MVSVPFVNLNANLKARTITSLIRILAMLSCHCTMDLPGYPERRIYVMRSATVKYTDVYRTGPSIGGSCSDRTDEIFNLNSLRYSRWSANNFDKLLSRSVRRVVVLFTPVFTPAKSKHSGGLLVDRFASFGKRLSQRAKNIAIVHIPFLVTVGLVGKHEHWI